MPLRKVKKYRTLSDMKNLTAGIRQNGEPGPERLLTVHDLARICQVTVRTVYGWNLQGIAPPRIKVGKGVRYRADDVQAWLNARRVRGRAAA